MTNTVRFRNLRSKTPADVIARLRFDGEKVVAEGGFAEGIMRYPAGIGRERVLPAAGTAYLDAVVRQYSLGTGVIAEWE